MAGAPSPERPVVLRRLGIIKDSNDGFLQESRAQRDSPQDALELFATEAESAPRVERWVTAIRSRAASSVGVVRRNAVVVVMAVSAVSVVLGIWAISQLVASGASSARTEPTVAADAESVGTRTARPTSDARQRMMRPPGCRQCVPKPAELATLMPLVPPCFRRKTPADRESLHPHG